MKREYVLNGLRCAQCAQKIETEINQSKMADASVNFATQTLTLQVDLATDENELLSRIRDIVSRNEPDVSVEAKSSTVAQSTVRQTSGGWMGLLREKKKDMWLLLGGIAFFAAGIALSSKIHAYWSLFLISYVLVGAEVLLRAGKNIIRGSVFDENFLMGIATLGAFAVGEYAEGAAVMLFYQIGELFQELAVDRSRKSIAALMDIRPDYANVMRDGQLVRIDPRHVGIGQEFVVKAGEKVPLDGVVVSGESFVDTSALTGESVPRAIRAGDDILSGSVNQSGVLHVRAEKEYAQSTVSKILELVENAASKKSPTEKFITKFAKIYTPVVVGLAVMIALLPPLIFAENFQTWVYRALLFLVISCPCALVISVPLGFFGGIGAASRSGILIKGGNYLEALSQVDTVVFDKTGTLTKGVFELSKIEARNGFTTEELLYYAAYAEAYSNHPIALSIQKAYGKAINEKEIDTYEELSGRGVFAQINGRRILAGNEKLLSEHHIAAEAAPDAATVVHLAIDGVYAGYLVIEDELKKDAKAAIDAIGRAGIEKIVMLTGDLEKVAKNFAGRIGIQDVRAQLLPGQKVEQVEKLRNEKKTKGAVVFVGDGINDAPALAAADVGVAMGGIGSDAAIEAADVVIMADEPLQIERAMYISRRTRKIVQQNIVFALGVKALVLGLGVMGITTMWEAVFADVGVALLAVFNSMRALKI